MQGRELSGRLVGVLILLAFSAGVGAASVAVLDVDPAPISAAAGELNESGELQVSGVENVYVGTNVSAVKVTVDDSDTGTATSFSVHLTLRDASGSILESVDQSGEVTAGAQTTVRVDLANVYSIGSVAKIEVVVEESN